MALSSSAAAAAVACLVLALAAASAGAATAPAPAPAVDCAAAASSLIDCLDYVSPGSNKNKPGKTCCGEVKAAVANPVLVDCLCSFMGSKNLPLPIDMKRVLALPGACGLSNAAFSKCHISGGAPTEAPSPSAGGSTSGGSTASPPPVPAAASSPIMATSLAAAVPVALLAYCYLF
ncbi:hypothetical protein EJB05_06352 [Eragrostis curvula]|uniref:Bifunctional inhibitor/plant lipid transfer protein/seed storage helical domain-containing protein n=1 Tax=Eragrostis curvula TaxID=38414 RepID=A0A5J9WES6_9POAL|nr:hypothetical protein EJB05_06352 [Eragrostis curvula]